MPVNDRTSKESTFSTADDHQLVRKVQTGDKRAFDELVKRHYKAVYNLVYHSVYSHEEREDLIQDIFIKVYRNIDKFKFKAAFSTWLFSITRNALIDRARKREIQQVPLETQNDNVDLKDKVVDPAANPEMAFMESDAESTLRKALMELDDDHKQILILREMEGLSYKELAITLGINMGTVKSRIARAREQLKQILSEML